MFVPANLALGALSGIGSLLDQAASRVGNSVSAEFAKLSQSTTSAAPQTSAAPSPLSGGKFDFGTLSALLSAQGQAGNSLGTQASALFSKLDTDGDGSISKTEFETALGKAGVDTSTADAVFNKLDANGDGSISKSELTPKRAAFHAHGGHHGSGSGGASSLNGADGSQTQTTTNSDGSTTTTITYADGSAVTMTMPAPQQSSGDGTAPSQGKGNLIERLIQMQSALINTQANATAAMA